MANYKEFVFHIENAKFTVLADQSIQKSGLRIVPTQYKRLHFHSYHEIFFVNSGTLTIQFENSSKTFSKNDLVIIAPGVNHCSMINTDRSNRYNLNFQMEKTALKTGFSLYDAFKTVLMKDCILLADCEKLRPTMENIVLAIIQDNERTLSMHFHQLVITLLEKLEQPAQHAPLTPVLSDSNMIRLYKLQQLMANSYNQDLSLQQIAETLHLSTRQASRIIRLYYGCTYGELVTRLRMRTAADLLLHSDMTILKIASQVGYNSGKGFYTHFKKHFGCLPTEYRKTQG